MDSFDRFKEDKLPPIAQWKNSLAGGGITVDQKDVDFAIKVFEVFDCGNLDDYHNLHLTSNTLLLECVMEVFRSICYQHHRLDSMQYYTASNLAGDAFLRIFQPNLKLLTEREHSEMAESRMRGGMASIYNVRLFTANNKFVPNFNPNQPESFEF